MFEVRDKGQEHLRGLEIGLCPEQVGQFLDCAVGDQLEADGQFKLEESCGGPR